MRTFAPSDLLTTAETAKYIGRSPRTLEKRRSLGVSPEFTKVYGRVFYRVADLDAFLLENETFDADIVTTNTLIDQLVSVAPALTSDQRSRLASLVGGA